VTDTYLDELNPAQRAAVEYLEGPCLVIAGPGSGKTRVLTYRIAHLLQQGVAPWSILALTFTNKAAREMKERVAQIVGTNKARYLWMGTFHSVFARILRKEAERIKYPQHFTIYDKADSQNLIKAICKSLQLDPAIYKPAVVAGRISAAKNSLIPPNVYLHDTEIITYDQRMRMPRIGEIYREYVKRSYMSGAMDFDDLLMQPILLFKQHPEALKKYQEQFSYILVDEYQDTNYVQYQMIKTLGAMHSRVCVVGDDAQSIYSFRGARIENILNFKNDYPNYELFRLEQNYRSTQNIVNAANSLIKKNKRQIAKKVFSQNQHGEKIKVCSAITDHEEGHIVTRQLMETRIRYNYNYKDYAILYRTNAQSRIFEEALRKYNIPYKIYGGLSFYQRKEIKDLLAYFRLIINENDNEALKRVINYPVRGIGQTTVEKLERIAGLEGKSIWQVASSLSSDNTANLQQRTITKLNAFLELIQEFKKSALSLNAFELATEVAKTTGILQQLYQNKSPEELSRYENIQELLNAIQEFTISAREEGQPDSLYRFMEEVALLTDQDTDHPEEVDRVNLMTVHMSKGLEFKYVFVVGLEENLFPSSQAIQQEKLEEERRLFYVALTRTAEQAHISFARQRYRWGNLEYCKSSRFLSEINEQYLEKTEEQSMTYTKNTGASLFQSNNNKGHNVQSDAEQNRKLVSLKKSYRKAPTNVAEEHHDQELQAGMIVGHQRFGKGKVLAVENEATPNRKATVFFQSVGKKQLLLKFAKLRIL
jgi:DNA helicase-2/ATP-dependent DNA helicase PcrA